MGVQERKIVNRNKITLGLFEYWHARLRGNELPARADISPRDLCAVLPFLFLADVQTNGKIVFRLFGSHIEQVLGCDLTGCALNAHNNRWADFAIQRDLFDVATYGTAIATTHELHSAGSAIAGVPTRNKRLLLRYDRLILPLSDDGQRVTMLLGALVADVRDDAKAIMRGPLDLTETERVCLPPPYLPLALLGADTRQAYAT